MSHLHGLELLSLLRLAVSPNILFIEHVPHDWHVSAMHEDNGGLADLALPLQVHQQEVYDHLSPGGKLLQLLGAVILPFWEAHWLQLLCDTWRFY